MASPVAEPTEPTLITPTPGSVLGATFPFKYVNPVSTSSLPAAILLFGRASILTSRTQNRTTNGDPRAETILIGDLFNTTYQNGFFPLFSSSDPTTSEVTLTLDPSVIAEGAYSKLDIFLILVNDV